MRVWGLILLVLASATVTAVAAEGLDERTRPLWERHWRVYAKNSAAFEDGFVVCPAYDKRYPSDAGMTVRQAEVKLSRKVKEGGGGLVMTRTVKMPLAEAEAMALPITKLSVGRYGFLASVQVDEVLGPESMVVKDLYLIDPLRLRRDYRADRARAGRAGDRDTAEAELERMYAHRNALAERQKQKAHRSVVLRLEGFSTDGLARGERWAGPDGEGLQVVIVKPEAYGDERRPKQRLVAVSLREVRWGLDEREFVRLLAGRGLSPAGFVGLVMEKMAEHDPRTAKGRVFLALLPTLEAPAKDPDTADGDRPTKPGGSDSAP
jgi:hypothetical protein